MAASHDSKSSSVSMIHKSLSQPEGFKRLKQDAKQWLLRESQTPGMLTIDFKISAAPNEEKAMQNNLERDKKHLAGLKAKDIRNLSATESQNLTTEIKSFEQRVASAEHNFKQGYDSRRFALVGGEWQVVYAVHTATMAEKMVPFSKLNAKEQKANLESLFKLLETMGLDPKQMRQPLQFEASNNYQQVHVENYFMFHDSSLHLAALHQAENATQAAEGTAAAKRFSPVQDGSDEEEAAEKAKFTFPTKR